MGGPMGALWVGATELGRENPDFPTYLICHGQKIGPTHVLATRPEVADWRARGIASLKRAIRLGNKLGPGANLPLVRSKLPLVLTQNCVQKNRPGAKKFGKLQKKPLVVTCLFPSLRAMWTQHKRP